jgi:hypothetical protein
MQESLDELAVRQVPLDYLVNPGPIDQVVKRWPWINVDRRTVLAPIPAGRAHDLDLVFQTAFSNLFLEVFE